MVTARGDEEQLPLAGATTRLLTLPNFGAANVGNYAVAVTNSGGTVTSAAATIGLNRTGGPDRLSNVSTRSQVQTGENVQIAGFVIGGSAPKPVLVRAAGPALKTLFGVSGALDDPTIEVPVPSSAMASRGGRWPASAG